MVLAALSEIRGTPSCHISLRSWVRTWPCQDPMKPGIFPSGATLELNPVGSGGHSWVQLVLTSYPIASLLNPESITPMSISHQNAVFSGHLPSLSLYPTRILGPRRFLGENSPISGSGLMRWELRSQRARRTPANGWLCGGAESSTELVDNHHDYPR